MAFRRRYTRRIARRGRKQRWTRWGATNRMRRVIVPTRLPRGMNTGLHHFKRTFQGADINASASGNVLKALTFNFNQMPNPTEFTTLFDQYKINAIKWMAVPNFTGSDLNPSSTTQSIPNMWSVIDHDDAIDPANLNEMLQYPGVKMTRGQQIHSRYFKPSVLADIAGIVATNVKYQQWLNLANITIPHYGVKYYVDQTQANVGSWRTYITLYFSCKGVR